MDRTDGLISKLVASLKAYLGLQREYVMLELTEKLTRLLTALILGAILFVITIITVIFFALTIVAALTYLTGNDILSYGIVTLFFVGLATLSYKMRRRWLVAPLTNFFTTLLLKDDEENKPTRQE